MNHTMRQRSVLRSAPKPSASAEDFWPWLPMLIVLFVVGWLAVVGAGTVILWLLG